MSTVIDKKRIKTVTAR